jgi:SAM-dependent methyltransferase
MKKNFGLLLLYFFSFLSAEKIIASGKEQDCEAAFTSIYDNEIWGKNIDNTPSSGWGSSMEYMEPYIHFLEEFFQKNRIKSVVDVGCGDWAFSRFIHWDNIDYLGIDVVKSVIERNRQTFTYPNIVFCHGDMLQMPLPTADLMICKEVLQCLTNEDILIFLKKIKIFKHCLITNDLQTPNSSVYSENNDIYYRGNSRPIDLTKPPFNVKGVEVFRYTIRNHIKHVFYIKN